MPRRPFSGASTRGTRAPRRLTSWNLGPGVDDITDAPLSFTTSTTGIYGAGVTPVIPNLTIVRLRGSVDIILNAAAAALDGYSYALGIGIVTGEAFTIGVTAMPDPFDDMNWPGWLWHKTGMIHSPVGALTAQGPQANQLIEIDSKAMRKFRLNEVLFGVCQVGEVGVSQLVTRMMTRVLVKLP